MASERLEQVPFQAHVELLESFLAHRREIVERIQGVLNAQRKPASYLQDRSLLRRHFEHCFFALDAVTRDQSRLRGQLEEAHWATGFKPREMPGLHNDLIDPAEMMIRGFHLWQRTRWPGRNGRVRYAQTLFNVYVLRCLELLSMRVWDAGSSGADERLSQVQRVLDALWSSAPADQPVLVRDARWLIPLAQSPTTDELAAYFEVAENIADSFSEEDRIEIRKAGVGMIGGHLRSQIRHYCTTDGVSIDDKGVVLRTRTSNALDLALLVQGLVPLLEAYGRACDRAFDRGDGRKERLELASAICQGISPDPELFLNRVDLLSAYSMIEHVFIAADHDSQVGYTPRGRRHVQLLQEYAALIRSSSKALYEDCVRFRPVDGTYSPYGAIYGTPSNLIEHMALKSATLDAATRFSLEDVFFERKVHADADAGADADANAAANTDVGADAQKLAWVDGWRKLPHIDPQVQKLFDYPQQFAEDIFGRIEQALRRCASEDVEGSAAAQTGRLFVLPRQRPEAESGSAESAWAESDAAGIPDLPARYIRSSDSQIVAAQKAESYDEAQLLHDREEGMFILSFKTSGGWVGITKDILTDVLGAGRDAKIAGLPVAAARVLSLMCPGLAVLPGSETRPDGGLPSPR